MTNPNLDYGLRYTVRYLYDLQKMRMAALSRPRPTTSKKNLEVVAPEAEIPMHPDDIKFMSGMGDGLKLLEAEAIKRIKKKLKDYPVAKWLLDQKGCGPMMTAVIISEVDIAKSNTVSSLWSYAGLGVVNGKAPRRRKGESCPHNPFLKQKMVKVLADSFVIHRSPWRKFYDDYKHRKQSTIVDHCMACANTAKTKKENDKCKNCGGTGGPAPWGESDLHRENASRRYMMKMFLQQLWIHWRELEGLDTRAPYAVEYLNRVHHG